MGIRVTQHMMYHDMVNRMQKNLSAYMESNEQGSTQKKINRPSDDPVGMYRVLTTRNAISSTEQYEKNAGNALGWLQLTDNILSSDVSNAIIRLKELAEQASTATYTPEQRRMIGYEASQIFGNLLNLSNTEFDGRHLFGGHIYDRPAYEMGLAVTTWDENWASNSVTTINPDGTSSTRTAAPPRFVIEGASDETIMIQFTSSGTTSVNALNYRWSNDGGNSWTNAVLPAGDNTLTAGGVRVTVGSGVTVDNSVHPPVTTVSGGLPVTAADPDAGPGANNGTLLYIRPTAVYMGDDNDPPPEVTFMGNTSGPVNASPRGTFHHDALVRMDSVNPAGDTLTYSYSLDSGSTWTTATTAIPPTISAATPLRLTVPGGYLDMDALPNMGAQVLIHPHRADLDHEIMKDTYLAVNNVGKDIFGGYYQGEPVLYDNGGDPTLSNDRALSKNLFEIVGNFIAYCENDNQEGCQRTLAALAEADKVILTAAAGVGAKENRVRTAQDVLSFQKIDQQEQLSYTEDIDLTELLTKLTQQQMTYSTVLKSSSMIMQLSLVNYV
ncbi:MAG: flagellar hook protein [Desulfovibrio sp.]|jgi:flagellar hook-associated protein 3 FlgL|nr:flagellar hook protein [Desulfovibrio sp.]